MPPDFFGTGWRGAIVSTIVCWLVRLFLGAAKHAELRAALAPDPDDKPLVLGAARSSRWPTVRAEHLKKCPRCVACGGSENVQVHHLRPFHLSPSLELDEHNLVSLCEKPSRNCHFHFGHSFDWKAYNEHCLEDAATFANRILTRQRM